MKIFAKFRCLPKFKKKTFINEKLPEIEKLQINN